MPIAGLPPSMPRPFQGTPKSGRALAEPMIPRSEKNACRGSKIDCPEQGALNETNHSVCHNSQLEKMLSLLSGGTFSAFQRD
jgi:hypothetical protein